MWLLFVILSERSQPKVFHFQSYKHFTLFAGLLPVIWGRLSQMGAYHTLDIEANRKFSLQKTYWDSISIERVEMACDPTQVPWTGLETLLVKTNVCGFCVGQLTNLAAAMVAC